MHEKLKTGDVIGGPKSEHSHWPQFAHRSPVRDAKLRRMRFEIFVLKAQNMVLFTLVK
jgi:hypothetical protein